MATCPTFSWGRGSVCHIGRQLLEKKKNLRLLNIDFFWFWAPVTEEERKRQRSKRRINAEERRRRKYWKRE